ncbi:Glucan endo-1,3-beta-glucosidase A1 [Orchesella cincta]|uniref:Glucan endo-1,3-beta-glucosidase A1 n=1 Tax=Orchesella cincta TaxID=48709 RepID=A0A1D2M8Z3_ORCCI|nr:Glucan endo-1,3-beta-glucosidase A1 [Orchesella cincta]
MGKLSILAFVALCAIGLASRRLELVWEDQFDGEDLGRNYKFDRAAATAGLVESGAVRQPFIHLHENGNLLQFYLRKIRNSCPFPKGSISGPLFWMMPQDSEYGPWPRSGELDIMEYRGQRPTNVLGTIHFGESKENKGQAGSPETTFPMDFSQDFHVHAVDWSPTKIMWMVDGKVYHEETLERNFWPSVYNSNGQPYDKAFHMIINLAVGGMFFGGEPFDPIEAMVGQNQLMKLIGLGNGNGAKFKIIFEKYVPMLP